MVNGVTGVGVNNQNYQMAFKAKGVNKQKTMEIVDKLGIQIPRDIELSRRPIEEQRENLLMRSVSKFTDMFFKKPKKDLFVEFIEGEVKAGKMEPDKARTILINHHIGSDDLVTVANELSRQNYLDELAKKDPELYAEVLRRDAEHKVASMSTMQLLKEIAKGLLGTK